MGKGRKKVILQGSEGYEKEYKEQRTQSVVNNVSVSTIEKITTFKRSDEKEIRNKKEFSDTVVINRYGMMIPAIKFGGMSGSSRRSGGCKVC